MLARWLAGIAIALGVVLVPYVYYRYSYAHSKRLREVVSGQVYRSGQLTAPGFRDAVRRYKIRTIINVQDEFPDPQIDAGFFTSQTIAETELCNELGVRYIHLAPDLVPRNCVPQYRPQVIDEFLSVMDDPEIYPVLIHCRAGLHRTGVLIGVYRMEYQGWTPQQAMQEIRALGFGDSACTSANDYIMQYVLTYKPRKSVGSE